MWRRIRTHLCRWIWIRIQVAKLHLNFEKGVNIAIIKNVLFYTDFYSFSLNKDNYLLTTYNYENQRPQR
jgi:hypothetical protein